MELTQKYVRSIMHYDEESGITVWSDVERNRRIRSIKCSGKVGSKPLSAGYTTTSIDSVPYLLHRLIWLYMTGGWPQGCLDHINGDKRDNRWCNLRDVTHQDNAKNTKLRVNNNYGLFGVGWSKRDSKWRAYITNNKVCMHLGYHSSFFEACCSRKSAEVRYNFHENHGRRL